jgi:hypothetical protein
MNALNEITDTGNKEQVEAYFAVIEREYPQLTEAMKVMNISQQQYIVALQALKQPASSSASSTRLSL